MSLRGIALAGLVLPLPLLAQSPREDLQRAWATYQAQAPEGEPGYLPTSDLVPSLEALGRAWAAWLLAQRDLGGVEAHPLAGKAPERTPTVALRNQRGPWRLFGLEVPVPCGTHTILALTEDTPQGARLRLLDLRMPPREGDLLGAREGVVTLLLTGGRVVAASTPPWCTSCWSRLDVRALAPGETPEAPRVLASFEDGVYRCADDYVVKLTPVPGTIRVDYTGHADPETVFKKRRHLLKLPK